MQSVLQAKDKLNSVQPSLPEHQMQGSCGDNPFAVPQPRAGEVPGHLVHGELCAAAALLAAVTGPRISMTAMEGIHKVHTISFIVYVHIWRELIPVDFSCNGIPENFLVNVRQFFLPLVLNGSPENLRYREKEDFLLFLFMGDLFCQYFLVANKAKTACPLSPRIGYFHGY